MFGLTKKKSPGAPSPAGPRIPTEKVVSLSSQGLSEPEIIKTLREEGFSPLEVDRAMKDALRTGTGVRSPPPQRRMGPPPGVAPSPPPAPPAQARGAPTAPPLPPGQGAQAQPQYPSFPGQPPQNQQQGFPDMPPDQYAPTVWNGDDDMEDDMSGMPKERKIGPGPFMDDIDDEGPPLPEPKGREPLPFAREPLPKGGEDRIRELRDRRRREVEELAEEVTEEKWTEMMNRVNSLEGKIDRMATGVKTAAEGEAGPGVPPQEIESIRNDIEAQKHTIEDVNARIDSLEEVVKGSLTPMVESIRKFSSAVKGTKQPSAMEMPKPISPPEPIKAPEPISAPSAPAPIQPEKKPPE